MDFSLTARLQALLSMVGTLLLTDVFEITPSVSWDLMLSLLAVERVRDCY